MNICGLSRRRWNSDYFHDRANTISLLNRRLQKPKLNMHNGLFNRLFGNGKIDIRPQGEVNIFTQATRDRISKIQHCRKGPGKMAASISTWMPT